MTLPRISIGALMVAVVAVALNVAVARWIGTADDELLAEVGLAGLAFQAALVGAVRSRGRRRLFWAGFVTAGALALSGFTHIFYPVTDRLSDYWFLIERFADAVLHRLALPCNLHGDTLIRPSAASTTTLIGGVSATEVAPHVFLGFLVAYAVLWSIPILAVASAGGFLALVLDRLWFRPTPATTSGAEGAIALDHTRGVDVGERPRVPNGRLLATLGLVAFDTLLVLFACAHGPEFPGLLSARLEIVLTGLAAQTGLFFAIRSRGRDQAFSAAFAAACVAAALIHLRATLWDRDLLGDVWIAEILVTGLSSKSSLPGFARIPLLTAISFVPQLMVGLAGGILAAITRGGRVLFFGLGLFVLLTLIAVVAIP